MNDYEDEKGEVHLQVPTIEHRADICKTGCPWKQYLDINEIHLATQRLLQVRLMLDAGRIYDADELELFEWQILGEMKRTQDQKNLFDMGIMMWGSA